MKDDAPTIRLLPSTDLGDSEGGVATLAAPRPIHRQPMVAARHERELLAKARAGDHEAWDALVAQNAHVLWAAIHDCGLVGRDAAAVWQGTWLTLAQRLDEPPSGGLRRWLLVTAATAASRVKLRTWTDDSAPPRGAVVVLAAAGPASDA